MNLNLGCGPKPIPGLVNVDLYADAADVKADVRSLPFGDGSADAVQMYHTIEHVSREDGLAVLREIHRVLKTGGTVAVETPDRLKCIALIRGAGPKSRPLNKVEGTRAATGLYYPDSPRLLNGVKGALGGASGTKAHKKQWHQWLLSRADVILAALEANDLSLIELPSSVLPGEPHVYLWHAGELRQAMEAVGFDAAIEPPQSHGQRVWRDCRVVGMKR